MLLMLMLRHCILLRGVGRRRRSSPALSASLRSLQGVMVGGGGVSPRISSSSSSSTTAAVAAAAAGASTAAVADPSGEPLGHKHDLRLSCLY